MHTGYFGKVKSYTKDKGYKFVSIACFAKFWMGEIYPKLFPPSNIIKIEDKELYKKLYAEQVLNKLDPKQVYDELGENAVLLCYEKKSDIENGTATCHRRLVADWLEEKLNIKVDEL